MDYFELGYLGLFIASFLAATILPLSSEFIFLGFILSGYSPSKAIAVATLGNSLGGFTNYGLGYLGNPKWLKKLGIDESTLTKFQNRIQKYGIWLGLISWVPFVGDMVTVVCGYFKVKFIPFSMLMVLGKFLRYIFIYFALA